MQADIPFIVNLNNACYNNEFNFDLNSAHKTGMVFAAIKLRLRLVILHDEIFQSKLNKAYIINYPLNVKCNIDDNIKLLLLITCTFYKILFLNLPKINLRLLYRAARNIANNRPNPSFYS